MSRSAAQQKYTSDIAQYNIKEVPSEEYRNQLAASLKQNISKYSCPKRVLSGASTRLDRRWRAHSSQLSGNSLEIDSKLAEQLAAVVTPTSENKGEQEWRLMLDSLARLDKLKEKELYLSSASSQLS
ncbi:unnamed protein product [Sphagnum jensenii]